MEVNDLENKINLLLLPISNDLTLRLGRIKSLEQQIRDKIIYIGQEKQRIFHKKNRYSKLNTLYEECTNDKFNNIKFKKECLNYYINCLEKKRKELVKENNFCFKLSLKNKKLELSKLLLNLIKDEKSIEQKKVKARKSLSLYLPNSKFKNQSLFTNSSNPIFEFNKDKKPECSSYKILKNNSCKEFENKDNKLDNKDNTQSYSKIKEKKTEIKAFLKRPKLTENNMPLKERKLRDDNFKNFSPK